jgi:hypothetical protein
VSIQPVRVLWRIVDDVARSPGMPFAVEQLAGASAGEEQYVDVLRLAADAWPAEAAPATLFHFWAHALRAFLERCGQGDQLEGAAGQAMCERLAPEAFEREIERYRRVLARPSSLVIGGRVLDAYRMMNGACRRSIAIETDAGPVALFFSHGPRTWPIRLA